MKMIVILFILVNAAVAVGAYLVGRRSTIRLSMNGNLANCRRVMCIETAIGVHKETYIYEGDDMDYPNVHYRIEATITPYP